MGKHTPGPWHKEPSPKGGYNIRDAYNNVPAIARTYNDDSANADLIVAAPDMLVALKSIAAIFSQPATFPADLKLCHKNALAAIARAERTDP